jgi:tetrahydromethanopterin S-methyltransferase subunit G
VTPRARRKDDGFDVPQRLHLVELDLDAHDEVFQEIRSELGRMKGIMLGILISTTTAALMLAATLAVGR